MRLMYLSRSDGILIACVVEVESQPF